ncbi:DEAD/DEAH box helicase [Clostridium aestuarii]|uniref:DEAD/DEAH box helicase n=1 Tax=Clostridium aestuarii TaxID=338193 RepID=A0ABT4CZ73_9CLOT|nr:DEAD/DEAH box helicase [Clostridium aestuarii]MCY6483250.1 DEAD/DEAH box helicase [Clostridium aestuarii]
MIVNRECIKKIDNLINKYIKLEIKREFLHDQCESEKNIGELVYLLENALILLNSHSNKNKERALTIATIVAKLPVKNKQLKLISSIILGRLRNFKSQELVDNNNEENIISPFDMLKNNLYKRNNTIKLVNKEYLLNNFQLSFYELVKKRKVVSVSAPTSVGKSFIIKRIIIDMLLNGLNCCVYVVPTRALITEVINEIRKEIRKEINIDDLNIGFNISSSSDVTNLKKEFKTILILTQERFYQLCNNNEIKVNVLIVDEAQNVIDGKRGVLLEYSIKYAKRLWKDLKLIFISPLINNPEKFTQRFAKEDESGYLNEMKSSVRQNIIKLYKDTCGYKITINDNLVAEKVRINRSASSISGNIASVVLGFNNGQNSIIYCNTTKLAVDVCEKIFNSGNYDDSNIDVLNEFADFIEYSISKKYLLSKYIRKGIVYHYGKLPPFIRGGIEELAAQGYFKIIACTSTLLQGINLPAQNIYVYNPVKGRGKKKKDLSNLEFWNLAGRAGRMGYDFCGNIILIQNKEWNDINKYDDKSNEVQFISDQYKEIDKLKKIILHSECNDIENTEDVEDIEDGEDIDDIDDNDGINDYIVSSTIIDRINHQKLINHQVENESYNNLEDMVDKIIQGFEPPKELLIRLVGMRYSNINKLWLYLKSNDSTIEKFLLPHPFNVDKKTFLKVYTEVIDIINKYLMNENLYNQYDKDKLKFMSYSWITENKLKFILLYKVLKNSSNKEYNNKEISKEVEKQVRYLNGNIRYKLVKGFYAYGEILKEYLKITGREKLAHKIINIPMYLEIGACKNSTVELVSLGMNREFAIEVVEKFKITENNSIEQLKKLDLSKLNNNYLKGKLEEFIETIK